MLYNIDTYNDVNQFSYAEEHHLIYIFTIIIFFIAAVIAKLPVKEIVISQREEETLCIYFLMLV